METPSGAFNISIKMSSAFLDGVLKQLVQEHAGSGGVIAYGRGGSRSWSVISDSVSLNPEATSNGFIGVAIPAVLPH